MTASAPSGAMKHVAKRPSDAKQQIIGQMAVDPTHSDVMSNSLGKTATRSKAGCMTCRIRRKKCDLQRNNDSCQTCSAKRPEALRDPAVVKEIQRRIKVHLASNNMIKGSARSSAAATPGQQILFFHNTPNHPQFTQSPSHIVHPPFSSTPLHSWHSPSSSDHSSGPRDASPFPPVHSLTTTAPQPSSTPSSDVPGGAAGGAGASYGGQSFLSFADLVGANSSSHNEAQTPASGRKGKSRQSKHAPVEATDDLSEDGSGEDDPDMHQGDRGSDEAASSFSRHPPGYPQPNYDPPQYSRRYPYEMGTPSQPAPYHAHAPHPYAQSDLRTRSYDYDNERDIRVDDNLRKAEREREAYRPQVPNGNLPHPPYERNMNGYQPFPRNDLIHGPGTGVASAGRAFQGYGPYGHAGYRGPSPSNSLNSSFPPGPQPKTDPFYNGLRLPMMDPRNAAAPLPGPILSFPMSRSGGTSPTSEHFLQPMDRAANGSVYSDSGYRSPNPAPGRSPMGAGMSSSHDSMANAAAETSEEAADVDGEPIVQLNPTPNVATNTQTQQPNYAPNPFLPGGSSFGQSYSFDKTFRDAELEGNSTGALVSAASNPAVNNNLPMDSHEFSVMMAILGIESLADAPAAIEANANTADYTQIGALQQLRVGMAPPPPIDSQLMYVATIGNQQLQFTSRQMELLHLYKNQLCNLQYHIAHSADASIADELFNLAMNSEAALFGTLTLTSLYKIRLRGSPVTSSDEMIEVQGFKDRVSTALEQRKSTSTLDSGDAMAALHMVSAVLFEGGTSSDWDQFLDIAKAYVAQHPVVTMKSWHSSPVMEGASSSAVANRSANAPTTMVDKKTQFIIKTVAWFDVIGSVTMRRAPFFLDTYRELFGRQGGAAMERIMGCNEKVLLAIAETAALAAWRREEEQKGTLNVMKLAKRAGEIEEFLSFVGPMDNGAPYNDYSNWGMDDAKIEQEKQARTVRLVSNVFRATGRLYLHTVVSQCNPDVQDIKVAVQSTIEAFQALQASAFDRSLVFPITLAGCMTDNKEYRKYLEGRLLQFGALGQAVGNTVSCLRLMQAVWRKRDQQHTGSRIVDWIDMMNDLGWSLLLV